MKTLAIGGLWNGTHSSVDVPEHVPNRKFNMTLFVGELQASVLLKISFEVTLRFKVKQTEKMEVKKID